MQYQVIKLKFRTAVHLGDGGLTRGNNTFYADTLFSALCHEAIKLNNLDELVSAVKNNRIRISDGLPYIGDTLYIPRPYLVLDIQNAGDSVMKKTLKKLEYIPVNQLDNYLKGKLDISKEYEYFHQNFGTSSLIEKARIVEGDDAEPFAISVYQYKKGSGLYVCVGYESDNDYYMLTDLLVALSYTGIGGKRSSGYGKFEISLSKPEESLLERLDNNQYSSYISLASAFPREEELEQVVSGASYRLIRRGGFIDSSTYAQNHQKKKDSYLMASGSYFEERFEGELFDVSHKGVHPVFRYAKPMMMGVM